MAIIITTTTNAQPRMATTAAITTFELDGSGSTTVNQRIVGKTIIVAMVYNYIIASHPSLLYPTKK
jgi:hypothetical protein